MSVEVAGIDYSLWSVYKKGPASFTPQGPFVSRRAVLCVGGVILQIRRTCFWTQVKFAIERLMLE